MDIMDIMDSGWWLTYPSEKYEFVSWDYIFFPIYGKIKHVPNHQPGFNDCNGINTLMIIDNIVMFYCNEWDIMESSEYKLQYY